MLLEPDGSTRLAAVWGLPPELAEEDYAAFRSSGCVCQQMLLAGELTEGVILIDCERLSAVNSGREAYPRNHATIPLRVGGKVLGNLNLVAGSARDFTEEELRLLTAAGDQFGVAVERAQLFGEVQQLAVTDSLTGLNNRRHLFALAEREFERAQRYANPLAIMMLDLIFLSG